MSDVDTFFASVREAFARHRDPASLIGFGAVTVIVVAGVLIAVLRSSWRGRRRAREQVRRLARDRGLSHAETELAARLARQAETSLLDVMTRLAAFERAAALALAEEAPTHAPGADSAFGRLRRLREALGFHVVPAHHWLLTTRELRGGERLNLGGAAVVVEDVNEACFSVLIDPAAVPEAPDGGAGVAFEVVRADDARYAVRSRVLATEAAQNKTRVFFAHDESPQRQQLREYVRVRVNRPVTFVPLETPASGAPKPVTGAIVDVSVGGMSFDAGTSPAKRSHILCSFELAEGARFTEVEAVVIDAKPTHGTSRFNVRIAFTSLAETDRDRLMAAVTWHEQQKAARSLL